MRKKRLFPGLWAFFWLFAVAASPVRAAGETLGFGLISSASPQAVVDSWQPLLTDMEQRLGMAVAPRIYDDYAGVIWAMAAGNVQIAWLGNKSAIEAVDRAGGEVALRTVDTGGRTEYFAHCIVRADARLADMDDVLARAGELTFGDGDANSTSGHVIPGYYLFAARRLDPRAIFKRVVQNNHENNFLAVADGRVDVATGNSVDLERLQRRYPEKFSKIRIIWTSPPVPSDPVVWRADLPAGLKDRIREFLLDYGQPSFGKSSEQLARETAVLAAMARSGFRRSDNRQLLSTRIIELHRERSRLLCEGVLDQQERQQRLTALDAKLDDLQSQGAEAP